MGRDESGLGSFEGESPAGSGFGEFHPGNGGVRFGDLGGATCAQCGCFVGSGNGTFGWNFVGGNFGMVGDEEIEMGKDEGGSCVFGDVAWLFI